MIHKHNFNQNKLTLTDGIQKRGITTYDVRNTEPSLGQAHTCGGIKQIMGPNRPLVITLSPMTIHIITND